MSRLTIKDKVLNLEAELRLVKDAVMQAPNFEIDEYNWRKAKAIVKKTRQQLARVYYGKGQGISR